MRAYSRQGQLQLAVRQYHTCVATLRRELGLSPAAATTALYNGVIRREAI